MNKTQFLSVSTLFFVMTSWSFNIDASNERKNVSKDKEVCEEAKKFTVRVQTSSDAGTGIIFRNIGNEYHVITNDHVLLANSINQTVNLTTAIDGKTHVGTVKHTYKDSQNPETADLAIIVFKSSEVYKNVENRAEKAIKGESVYLVGFPRESKAYNCKKGKIFLPFLKPREFQYSLAISPLSPQDSLVEGMSGGALLDSNARVIGINGKRGYKSWGSFRYYDGTPIQLQNQTTSQTQQHLKPLSWAIPINVALETFKGDLNIASSVSRSSDPNVIPTQQVPQTTSVNVIPTQQVPQTTSVAAYSTPCKQQITGYSLDNNDVFSIDISNNKFNVQAFNNTGLVYNQALPNEMEKIGFNCIERITPYQFNVNSSNQFIVIDVRRRDYKSFGYSILIIFDPKTNKYNPPEVMPWDHPSGYETVDIDRDGTVEFAVYDGSFVSNLCSLKPDWTIPLLRKLYKVKDGKISDVTILPQFRSFLNQQKEHLWNLYKYQVVKNARREDICGTLTTYAATKYLLREDNDAKRIIDEATFGWSRSDAAKYRQALYPILTNLYNKYYK